MYVGEIIEWLKQVIPSGDTDYEVYVSTQKNLGNEKESKDVVNILLDKENGCIVLVIK